MNYMGSGRRSVSGRFRALVVATRRYYLFSRVIPVGVAATAGREFIAPGQRYLVTAIIATVYVRQRRRQSGAVHHNYPSKCSRLTFTCVRPRPPDGSPTGIRFLHNSGTAAARRRGRRAARFGRSSSTRITRPRVVRQYSAFQPSLSPTASHTRTRPAEYINPTRLGCQRDFNHGDAPFPPEAAAAAMITRPQSAQALPTSRAALTRNVVFNSPKKHKGQPRCGRRYGKGPGPATIVPPYYLPGVVYLCYI